MSGRLVPFIPDGYIEYDNLSDDAKQDIIDQNVSDVTFDESIVPNKFIFGKQVYQKMIDFGQLPNATSKAVDTGFPVDEKDNYQITDIMLLASDPLPSPNTRKNIIIRNALGGYGDLYQDTSINKFYLVTSTNLSIYTQSRLIIEYVKQKIN